MKRTILTAFIFCISLFGYTQNFVKLTNGNSVWIDDVSDNGETVTFKPKDGFGYSVNKKDIAYIEYLEGGLHYINTDNIIDLNTTELQKTAKEDPNKLIQKGNSVYIPFSSTKVVTRSGGIRLRKMVQELGYWNVVGCDKEAHFILEFVYDERGKDKAYIILKTRDNIIFYKSKKVSAKDFIPSHAGQESAEKLFRKLKRKLK